MCWQLWPIKVKISKEYSKILIRFSSFTLRDTELKIPIPLNRNDFFPFFAWIALTSFNSNCFLCSVFSLFLSFSPFALLTCYFLHRWIHCGDRHQNKWSFSGWFKWNACPTIRWVKLQCSRLKGNNSWIAQCIYCSWYIWCSHFHRCHGGKWSLFL